MISKLILISIALSLTLHGSVATQTRDGTTVDAILAAAANTVGSASEIAKIRSIRAVADCDGPKGKYTTTVTSFRGSKTLFEQTYAYRDRPSNVFINGDIVWENSGQKDQPALSTPFQRMIARAHEYQKMSYDLRSFFHDIEFAGEEIFEERPSVKLSARNELGMTTLLYFDKNTNRFIGYVLQIPDSDETVKNVVLTWQQAGKLLLPSIVRATDKEGDWTLRFTNIKVNVANERTVAVPPRIADLAELMRLHDQQKQAHLSYNGELFTDMFADRLTQLQRGDVTVRTKSENLTRIKAYFSSYKFIEWEDIVPPVIKLSKDGSLAAVTVQKRVRGTYKDDAGTERADDTIFAWLEVWEKIAGKWKVITVASTDKAGTK
jgi:hypothetical protein